MTGKDIWILNLETSTKNCSAGIFLNGEEVSVREVREQKYSHSEKLNSFIEECLKEAGITMCEISAVAVSGGPGSYTGLRIGVSTAKGICYGLDIPLIAVDTMRVLAVSRQIGQGYIIPVLDARRMEVYQAVFDRAYERVKPTISQVLEPGTYREYLDEGKVVFVGDAVGKMQEVIRHPNAVFVEHYPSAREMGRLSYRQYLKEDFVDTAYFEPFYLKDFIAVAPVSKLK